MRLSITAVLAIAVLACAACGDGESDQERAQNQVCDARADIQEQLSELGSLRLDTATVDGIKQRLNAIKDDLAKIEDAESSLDDQRKQQVESASRAFRSQVDSVVKDLDTSRSLSGALTELQNSLIQLRDGYQEALAPIDCG
jgi:chromosome segregation ATPase